MSFDLALGTVTGTTQEITNTGGSGVTLPSATTTDAGLMGADDKVDLGNSIQQGGNAFAATMNIGTLDSNSLNFRTNNTLKGWFDASTNNFYIASLANQTSVNNSLITLGGTGASVTSNKANSDTTLTVNNANASSTGNIQTWQKNSITVAEVNTGGNAIFPKVAINNSLTAPSAMLDVNAGTTGGLTVLGNFSTNGGSVQISNGTSAASQFTPAVVGKAAVNPSMGLGLIGSGLDSYSLAALVLSGRNANNNGPVISGNVFCLENYTSGLIYVDHQGATKITNLAGSGTRMVTADSTGTLNATTEVSSGTYVPTILSTATSYTAYGFKYTRIGNIVHVSGAIEVTGCTVGYNSIVIILPIDSMPSSSLEVTGTVSGINIGSPTTSGTGNSVSTYYYSSAAASIGYESIDTYATISVELTYMVQ